MSDDVRDLIAAYALDAVDRADISAVESAVADDAELRNELDGYRETLAVLVDATEPSPSTPSPRVWEAIDAELAGTQRPPAPEIATVSDIRSSRRWSRLGAIISVAAVAVSLVLGLRVVDLQNQVDADPTLEDLASSAMNDPNALIVDLVAQEGYEGASARIVVDDDGLGYVVSDTLEALESSRTYQLWAIVADGGESRVISAGVLGPDPGISQFQTQAALAGFAITEEIAGGVAVSESPAVVVWLDES